MEQKIYDNYINILKEELVPALGCTEPIAIAYAGAKAREILGTFPQKVIVKCSGNIIKNVKGVTVPNSGDLKGIDTAALLGIIGGNADMQLEVLESVTDEDRVKLRQLLKAKICSCDLVENTDNLYIDITVVANEHKAQVIVSDYHTNIIRIVKDDEVLYDKVNKIDNQADKIEADRNLLNVKDIIEFADTARIEDVKDILDLQIECNVNISEEGLAGDYGANIGKVLLKTYGTDDVKIRAKAKAAAGSDARMNGCEMPVVINSGSGNQGITASIPVIEYAKELGVSDEKRYRALLVSNLITIHLKSGIGRLSAYCGAVSAGCASGAGIAYLYGGGVDEVSHTIVNSLAITSGIICDGAKASCAAKIATAIDAGILGYHMYKEGQQFYGGDGIVSKGVENTIKNVGQLAKEGMATTDQEILKIMTKTQSI